MKRKTTRKSQLSKSKQPKNSTKQDNHTGKNQLPRGIKVQPGAVSLREPQRRGGKEKTREPLKRVVTGKLSLPAHGA